MTRAYANAGSRKSGAKKKKNQEEEAKEREVMVDEAKV